MSGSTGNYNSSGSDTITLKMSEDQALGVDAQFTVNVDGQQIGGPQTVTASHAAGQNQAFSFQGNYNPGPHDIVVTFVNNFIYPGLSGDRNVYVEGVTYDGQTVSSSTTPIYESPFFPPNSTNGNVYGNAVFHVNDTTPVPNGAPSTPTTTPGRVSVGSGSDTLVLNMAEDPYQGDAQFTVSVDGRQIGGLQTTTAIVSQGQQQEFDIHGSFGGGNHSITVNFTNDLIGDFYPPGTPGLPPGQWAVDTTDRNLYVMGVSLNGGASASGAPWELSSNGSHDFSVTAGSNPSATGSGATASTIISNTATITTDSLNTGQTTGASPTGMSFMATSGTTDTGASTPESDISSTRTGMAMAAETATSMGAAVAGMTTTIADYAVPSTLGESGTNMTSPGNPSMGNWWMNDQGGNMNGSAFPQHG